MIGNGVQGVEFICANTDAQALVLAPPALYSARHQWSGRGQQT
jgi:cell division GTPase FtsZ